MVKAQHDGFDFVIQEDHPDVGVYLYVYKDGSCIRDFLQNDVATCIDIAFEDYGVPRESWSQREAEESDV